MFSLLHQYLINHSSVSLPGIGTLQFVNTSALPLANGYIMPPKREIKLLNNDVNETSPQLLGYLSKQLDMSETQSQTLFQQFIQSIKTALAEKKEILWENLGEFRNDDAGNIHFIQTPVLESYYQPIEAKRINHHNKDKYDVLVGDNETNNIAIQEELNGATDKKSHWWWIWAIIIAVIALVVIAVKYAS